MYIIKSKKYNKYLKFDIYYKASNLLRNKKLIIIF